MRVAVLAGTAFAVWFLHSASVSAATCDPLVAVTNAFNSGDEAAAEIAVTDVMRAACSVEDQAMTGRIVALLKFNRITTAVSRGANIEKYATELEDLKDRFGGPWQVLDGLGDVYRNRRDYVTAAQWYQAALDDADNKRMTLEWMAPDPAYTRRMDRMQTEMRLASPKLIPMSTALGCKGTYRGVTLASKMTQISFAPGTATFNGDGEAAAADLSRCLKSLKPKSVTLIGHTEPNGDEGANMALSVKRAQAVAKYLAQSGFTVPVEAQGKGETEPFMLDEASAYDMETLNRIDRRMEAVLQY